MVRYVARGTSEVSLNCLNINCLKSPISYPIWGAVAPLKIVSQLKSIPFCNQCSKTFHMTQVSLSWEHFKICGSGAPKYLNRHNFGPNWDTDFI